MHAYLIAVDDRPCSGIIRMQLDALFRVLRLQHFDVRKCAVQEIARRRRNHRQRVSARKLRHCDGRLMRRMEHRQRVEAELQQPFAPELALARCRRESAIRERRVRLRNRESRPSVLLQRVERDAGIRRMACQRGGCQVFVRIAKARATLVVAKPHPLRELPEDFGVGLRFAERGDRRVVDHPVQMTIRRMDVEVLELRRCRQQNVGVVGGVGLEVLEHNAEEIFARKTGDHLV